MKTDNSKQRPQQILARKLRNAGMEEVKSKRFRKFAKNHGLEKSDMNEAVTMFNENPEITQREIKRGIKEKRKEQNQNSVFSQNQNNGDMLTINNTANLGYDSIEEFDTIEEVEAAREQLQVLARDTQNNPEALMAIHQHDVQLEQRLNELMQEEAFQDSNESSQPLEVQRSILELKIKQNKDARLALRHAVQSLQDNLEALSEIYQQDVQLEKEYYELNSQLDDVNSQIQLNETNSMIDTIMGRYHEMMQNIMQNLFKF